MFPRVDYWDVALWAVAGYIAVVTLARLVVYYRDRLVNRARDHVAAERRRHAALVHEHKRQDSNGREDDRRNTAA
jgi:hypothetical protein